MIKKITSFSLPVVKENTFSLTTSLRYSEDVKSIDSIVNAYYSIISDSYHQTIDFERLKFLHLNNTLIVKICDSNDTYMISLEAEYSAVLSELKNNLHKVELNRFVNKYGNFAQVLSTYEIRKDPKIATDVKGSDCFQLYYIDERWWIAISVIQVEELTP